MFRKFGENCTFSGRLASKIFSFSEFHFSAAFFEKKTTKLLYFASKKDKKVWFVSPFLRNLRNYADISVGMLFAKARANKP